MLEEMGEDVKESTSTVTSLISISTRNHMTGRDFMFKTHIIVTYYVLILIFSLSTNLVLNYLLFTRKYMRIKYIYTASISISHIIICIVVIPLAIFVHVTSYDVTVPVLACDVIVCFCVGVTSHSMLGTAIRRCLAISERFRHSNFTYRGKVKNIVFIWIFSLVISLPYIFNEDTTNVFSFISNQRQNVKIPTMANRTKDNITLNDVISGTVAYHIRKQPNVTESAIVAADSKTTFGSGFSIYNTILLFVQMVIPCLAALILQTTTLFGLRRRPNQIHWVKEILITKQHICMAVVFLVCWLPLMLTNMISDYIYISDIVFHILQPLALSCMIYFPIIYYVLNAHIKREFLLMIQIIVNR